MENHSHGNPVLFFLLFIYLDTKSSSFKHTGYRFVHVLTLYALLNTQALNWFFNLHIINIQVQKVLINLICVLPRMFWPTWYGRRDHLQPADHRLFHPPCSFWSAEVVPLLRPAQQKGTGERLDGCRKWQMAMDPGNRCTEWHWSWTNLSSLNENEC